MIKFHRVCATTELLNGEKAGFVIDHHNILIVKLANRFLAYENACPHQGVPLSEGDLKEGVLTCFAHQWEFDALTGKGINPESSCLVELTVKVEEENIWVGWEDKP